jgi:transposase
VSDATVVKLLQPGSFADPLSEVLRNGARALLAQAIEAEVAEFLAKHADLKTAAGLRRVVRHGHLPEREVLTGIGPVGVRQPRVRDRGAAALTRPSELGLPFASWTLDRLVSYLSEQGIAIRRSRISEIFIREGLRWRQDETWFGARVDPDFAKKGRSNSSTQRRRRAA